MGSFKHSIARGVERVVDKAGKYLPRRLASAVRAVAWTMGYCRGAVGRAMSGALEDAGAAGKAAMGAAEATIGHTTDVINKVGDAGALLGGKAAKFAMTGADEAEKELAAAREAAKGVARAALNILK